MEEVNSRSVLILNEAKNKVQKFLMNFVVKPIFSGVLGFLLFMLVIATTKYLGCCVGTIDKFSFDFDDVILSALGFFLVFLIRLLENFRDKTTNQP